MMALGTESCRFFLTIAKYDTWLGLGLGLGLGFVGVSGFFEGLIIGRN